MIQISGLEFLTTAYSVTSSSVDDMGSLDNIYTTATSVSTTLASAPQTIQIDIANRYIDSLSVQQLAEIDQKIQAKEMELDGMTVQLPDSDKTQEFTVLKEIEEPKVFKKSKQV